MKKFFIAIFFSTVLTLCVNAQKVDKPVLSNSSTIKTEADEVEKISSDLPVLENSSKKNEIEVSKKPKQKDSNVVVPEIGAMNKKDEY
jgi:hypothetical protein